MAEYICSSLSVKFFSMERVINSFFLLRHFNTIISEPNVKIIDFDFTLAYLGSNFYFKAYYDFISVYCPIFKRFKVIIGWGR